MSFIFRAYHAMQRQRPMSTRTGIPTAATFVFVNMLKLVGDNICVLNPTKDNLICDAAKVEEILGVGPRQVIDVMALRGDSIDNIPGAPGIGDKGSVELIKRFGSVENALDRAEEVERKTYRESLLNNRDVVLRSKELVTIDVNVPVHLNLVTMQAQEPDYEACRVLFNELEFTTLLKDFVRTTDAGSVEYGELKGEQHLEKLLKLAGKHQLALAICAPVAST